ncbi:MAG: hypothetical protein NT070_00150 [Cyanobacteria bacterium]|nr:hypothetical protein [Cyanobacteriota bacterium]
MTKDAVMEEVRFQREEVGLTVLDPDGLRDASGGFEGSRYSAISGRACLPSKTAFCQKMKKTS